MGLVFDPVDHRYTVDGVVRPHVTGVLRDALGDPFAHVPAAVLARAKLRGRAVHRACELDARGELDESSVDATVAPYLAAWRAFRKEWRLEIIAAEVPLYHPTHGYACTPDIIARSESGPLRTLAVVEIKSGFTGLYAQLQTAAQAQAAEAHFGAGDTPALRFVLRLGPDGKARLTPHHAASDWRDFLSCLNVSRLKERAANE